MVENIIYTLHKVAANKAVNYRFILYKIREVIIMLENRNNESKFYFKAGNQKHNRQYFLYLFHFLILSKFLCFSNQSVNEIGLIILLISNFCFWKFKKAFQV